MNSGGGKLKKICLVIVTDSKADRDGTDKLKNVEVLQFSDKSIESK
ncbi:MAG: hypothetical protein U9Q97_10675 [Acidobacteriota bacterium]|nr:hypothetical protein [Acidobacteriota bacterium]